MPVCEIWTRKKLPQDLGFDKWRENYNSPQCASWPFFEHHASSALHRRRLKKCRSLCQDAIDQQQDHIQRRLLQPSPWVLALSPPLLSSHRMLPSFGHVQEEAAACIDSRKPFFERNKTRHFLLFGVEPLSSSPAPRDCQPVARPPPPHSAMHPLFLPQLPFSQSTETISHEVADASVVRPLLQSDIGGRIHARKRGRKTSKAS
jgi:hypothetical protein